MHGGKNCVAAGLQRVVQVLAHTGHRCHCGEGLRAHVLGVRAREADTADASNRTDGAQQVREQRTHPGVGIAPLPCGKLQVAAVAVHVLPEQGHLGYARSSERPHLGDDVLERSADLYTAHCRNDAEGALVVAADLDGDPGVVRRLTLCREGRREHGVVVDDRLVEDLGDRATRSGLTHEDRRSVHVVGAEHYVDVRCLVPHEVLVLLGKTASDHNLTTVLLTFPGLQVTEGAVQLVVGVLPDATRVQHHHIGVFFGFGLHEAVFLQQSSDAFGVVLVHLAPEGANDVTLGHQKSLGPSRAHRGAFG
ncbi:unannotated protein [freshwater metagenome]|uniref:Unannotated protein n=1 Tax=freshwater metagenome TaxID=449393 RepID=A0A6J6P6S4_9ZZZZ